MVIYFCTRRLSDKWCNGRISADSLVNGTALKISSGSALKSGSLLHICTATFNNGGGGAILDIEANKVEGERVVRIQSNSLTTGAALEINAVGNNMESSGRVIDIQASGQSDGTLMKVDASSLEVE